MIIGGSKRYLDGVFVEREHSLFANLELLIAAAAPTNCCV